MTEIVTFRLKLTGGIADRHEFQGYDGYMALAGFAWTLSLISNYTETGKIRQRGDFPGRDAVRATVPAPGSIIADFAVWLTKRPADVLGLKSTTPEVSPSVFFYDLVRWVTYRNLGQEPKVRVPLLTQLLEKAPGDTEALAAKTEPAIRQTHSVIGNGALKMECHRRCQHPRHVHSSNETVCQFES